MRWMLAASAVAFASASAVGVEASPLEAHLAEIARTTRSTLGIYVEHLERHETAGVNAGTPFPMASTFKLPLAVAVLREVEQEKLPPLGENVRLEAGDMLSWASPLHERMPEGGEATLREVLASMLETSDNSAADALLRLAGGAASVRGVLTSLGLPGISIDRGEAEMALDSVGVACPRPAERSAARIDALMKDVPRDQRRAALHRWSADPRDHASPEAMARVLARLWRGGLLAGASSSFLRDELARCGTGARRFRAGLPPDAPLAHRTGTCYGLGDDDAPCANDIGVFTLPSGEHVVVAAYVEDSGGPVAAKERLLASIAKAVWSYYAASR